MTPSTTGGTSDGQVGTRLEAHRATALRPRRLVGRDAEVAEVIERLALTPLTTVTGPGGVGKTSLALTVAAAAAPQFPDGVFVIWLASLRSAEHIAGEVAAQVGMPRSGGQSYEDSLTQWLADRDVLLVLDNCEHVVSAVADLVEGLTARLPRLRVLATSREPLWVLDELSYRLAPLAVVGQMRAVRRSTRTRGCACSESELAPERRHRSTPIAQVFSLGRSAAASMASRSPSNSRRHE